MLPRTAGDGKNGRADVWWEESAEAKHRNVEEVAWKIRFSSGVTEEKKKMKEDEGGGEMKNAVSRCGSEDGWEALRQVMDGA